MTDSEALAAANQCIFDMLTILGEDQDGDTNPGAMVAGIGFDGYFNYAKLAAQIHRDRYEECLDELPARKPNKKDLIYNIVTSSINEGGEHELNFVSFSRRTRIAERVYNKLVEGDFIHE